MSAAEERARILLIDPNIVFARRLTEALRHRGFEVLHCTQAEYGLTMVEWSKPVAILCAANLRQTDDLQIPRILAADQQTCNIPVFALGDGQSQALIQAYRAGYNDYIDRHLGAERIAGQVAAMLSSRRDGFRPTQMLTGPETALDGQLSLIDLPSVMQMLAQLRQTGALHVNAGATDGILFFEAGEIVHAESGPLTGDAAVLHMVKSCHSMKDGVYKFISGSTSPSRTVQRSVTDLMLDALRELDEQQRDSMVESNPSVSGEVGAGLRPALNGTGETPVATRAETEGLRLKEDNS